MPQGLCTRGCKQGWSVGGIAAPSASQLSFADHHIAQNQQKDNDKDNNKDNDKYIYSLQTAIFETFALWDIWSEWSENMTWKTKDKEKDKTKEAVKFLTYLTIENLKTLQS